MNEEAATKFGPAFNFYYQVKKFFTLYQNFKELAASSKIDFSTL